MQTRPLLSRWVICLLFMLSFTYGLQAQQTTSEFFTVTSTTKTKLSADAQAKLTTVQADKSYKKIHYVTMGKSCQNSTERHFYLFCTWASVKSYF